MIYYIAENIAVISVSVYKNNIRKNIEFPNIFLNYYKTVK